MDGGEVQARGRWSEPHWICPHVRGGPIDGFDHCSLHLGSRAEQDVARVPSVAAAAERPWIGRRCIRQNKTLAAAELCHKHLLLRAIHSAGVGGASATLLFLQLAHRQRVVYTSYD